jgi:hypothetical protein
MRDFLPGFNVGSDMGFARGVLLLEDCEGAFTWSIIGTGGDDVHTFAAAAAFMGAYGMQLKTRTTNPAENDYVEAYKFMGFPESKLVVVRLRWASPDLTKVKSFVVDLYLRDGATTWQASLRFDTVNHLVKYLNAAGGSTTIVGMGWTEYPLQFVTAELVIDANAMEYLSVMANGVRAELPDQGLYEVGAETYRACDVGLTVTAAGAAPAEVYVDSVYVGEFLSA